MSKEPLVIRREYQPDIERQIAALERVLAIDLADALARAGGAEQKSEVAFAQTAIPRDRDRASSEARASVS